MAQKTNNILKILVIILLVVLALALVAKFSGSDDDNSSSATTQGDEDTQSESLAGLSQQVVELQAKIDQKEGEESKKIDALNAQNQQALDKLKSDLATKSQQVQTTFSDKFAKLETLLSKPSRSNPTIGAGQLTLVDGYIWNDVASGSSTQALTGVAQTNLGITSVGSSTTDNLSVPVYTVPVNSTLMDSIGMTALIGRVPIGGSVTNPIPFKVVTGRKALLANGFELPEVEEAIWYGYATGNATLHCVSGRIESVTFIFTDGTIQTVGGDGFSSGQGLGWISNNQGVQCIPGEYVSNASKIMAQLFMAGTATGFANAAAQSEITSSTNANGISQVVTGDTLNFALGRGIGAGFSEWASYIRERARDQFDAVVVQPGAELAIHIQKEIPIDYHVNGRKIRYDTARYTPNLGVD